MESPYRGRWSCPWPNPVLEQWPWKWRLMSCQKPSLSQERYSLRGNQHHRQQRSLYHLSHLPYLDQLSSHTQLYGSRKIANIPHQRAQTAIPSPPNRRTVSPSGKRQRSTHPPPPAVPFNHTLCAGRSGTIPAFGHLGYVQTAPRRGVAGRRAGGRSEGGKSLAGVARDRSWVCGLESWCLSAARCTVVMSEDLCCLMVVVCIHALGSSLRF
jgi:hypothetical protein